MVDPPTDTLLGDALFGPDGTQSPAPPPVLADPLAGFADGFAGAGDAAVGQQMAPAVELAARQPQQLLEQDVQALRRAVDAALVEPTTSRRRQVASVSARPRYRTSQPRVSQPRVLTPAGTGEPRGGLAARTAAARPVQRRRGRGAGYIVALLIVAAFIALRVFGGELSALLTRLFHQG